MPTFILNDEKQTNSYGFRILNSGINLERFKANPIMLDDHYNSTRAVLGKWLNPRIEGSQLLADDEFDADDADAQKIAGKVKRGYIKGASMGVTFNRELMKQQPDDSWVLEKCDLYEASIVAIPSNANSLRLFAESGTLLNEEDIKLSISELTTNFNSLHKPDKMSKLILSATALVALAAVGITGADDETSVSNGIETLKSQLDLANSNLAAEKTARQALQASLDEQKKTQATALVDGAIAEGKLTAALKDQFVKMASDNYELAATVIGSMPAKTSLSGKVNNTTTGSDEGPKTVDEFEKLSDDKKMAFKTGNPEGYKALFV